MMLAQMMPTHNDTTTALRHAPGRRPRRSYWPDGSLTRHQRSGERTLAKGLAL